MSPQVRVVAGPGTGKSRSIEERVGHFVSNGIPSARIAAVSFTNASTRDLKDRIEDFAQTRGLAAAAQVRVSTLHSLALRILRRTGQLGHYPVSPLVMDGWELENILELEFSNSAGYTPGRCADIRKYNEAYWSAGQFNHPYYIPPNPPISAGEQQAFQNFYMPRTQLYACVLPGDIIRQCVVAINAGNVDPVAASRIDYLIVDEYQDLNSIDQELVDSFVRFGASIFVAGDDDQSVYSFRFAEPSGIQSFLQTYNSATGHTLTHCFRCPPEIVTAAESALLSYPLPNRIPKQLHSMWANANPPVLGTVLRCRWPTDGREADGIAQACHDLVAAGISPDEIMILLSNKPALGPAIISAFDNLNIPHAGLKSEPYIDDVDGRLVLAILRIVSNPTDYIAHRTILGLLRGVGGKTLNQIAEITLQNGLNFRNLFYQAVMPGMFPTRAATALQRAVSICAQIGQWDATDDVFQRGPDIGNFLQSEIDPQSSQRWLQVLAALPPATSLEETRDYISARTDEQKFHALRTIHDRLGLPPDELQEAPPQVKILTMHGAKGLGAKIVFIPGLEEEIFPGARRQPYPGLISEAARLLYVSITRARAACVLSYAQSRRIHGQRTRTTPSRFANHTGGAFSSINGNIPNQTIQNIIQESNLV